MRYYFFCMIVSNYIINICTNLNCVLQIILTYKHKNHDFYDVTLWGIKRLQYVVSAKAYQICQVWQKTLHCKVLRFLLHTHFQEEVLLLPCWKSGYLFRIFERCERNTFLLRIKQKTYFWSHSSPLQKRL